MPDDAAWSQQRYRHRFLSLRTWKRKPGCVREAKPFRVIVRGPVFWAAFLWHQLGYLRVKLGGLNLAETRVRSVPRGDSVIISRPALKKTSTKKSRSSTVAGRIPICRFSLLGITRQHNILCIRRKQTATMLNFLNLIFCSPGVTSGYLCALIIAKFQ